MWDYLLKAIIAAVPLLGTMTLPSCDGANVTTIGSVVVETGGQVIIETDGGVYE